MQLSLRLVNLTESIWLKIGLNMTETDKPYLFEHDRKVTPTNVNLLNSTENDWILQIIENIIIFGHIQPFMYVVVAILIFWLYSTS